MNDGVKYKINNFVVTGAKESVPVFGQIIDILVYNTDLVLFELVVYDTFFFVCYTANFFFGNTSVNIS